MWTKLIIICLLSISKVWSSVTSAKSRSNSDADVDFCENPLLSGGVIADNGETYLFKGTNFWQIGALPNGGKIIGYAKPTSSQWPQITNGFRLVFSVPQNGGLMTVFVVKNQWFGYQKGSKVKEGTVDSWQDFKDLSITAGFSAQFNNGTLVYVLHSDNKNYTLYDFKDISRPTKKSTGPTTLKENYLLFTEDCNTLTPTAKTLDTHIDVRAGITYRDQLFLLSKDNYCVVDLNAKSCERKCELKNVNSLLGCPLDISKRPASSKLVTIAINTEMSIEAYESSTLGVILPTNSDSSAKTTDPTKESNDTIKTGIPILGGELDLGAGEENSDSNTAIYKIAPVEESALFEKKRQNSFNYFIAFVVAMTVLFICTLLLVAFVSRLVHKNKHKGSVAFID